MNILIPMAGAGSRFAKAGYTFPKPLIKVNGKPMIQVIVENLNLKGRHIFLVRKEHYDYYNLEYMLNIIRPDCKIITVDKLTEGAACTTLLAEELINTNEELIIANSDQWISWDSNLFVQQMEIEEADGGILTFPNTHPQCSYVRRNLQGYVGEVQEKKVISNEATVGVYYWTKGYEYVKYAKQMIRNNIRTNNEFYVAPVYNEAIIDKKLIVPFKIKTMMGLGTPEDLDIFLKSEYANV